MALKLASVLLVDELHQYIKEYDIRGKARLWESASDVFDGSYDKDELKDLINHRLLEVIDCSEWETGLDTDYYSLCGSSWTVGLTNKAMLTFWPDRMEDARTNTSNKRPVQRASIRQRQIPVRGVRKRRTRRPPHN